MLAQWAEKNIALFTGIVIPNVFGPFNNPYSNSLVATFSYQMTHNEEPRIDDDAQLKVIYVGDLVKIIYDIIGNKLSNNELIVPYTNEIKVTEILSILQNFKLIYFEKGIFPDFHNTFERNLFNTFVSYMDLEDHFPIKLKPNIDERGSFVETIRTNSYGQLSFSTTKPGVTRGNHFHARRAERFVVIKGRALIQLRRVGTDKVLNFEQDGMEPAYVDIPCGIHIILLILAVRIVHYLLDK